MQQKPIPRDQAFAVSPETRRSFAGNPNFYELSGPGTLVRLVQFGKRTYDGLDLRSSRISGEFWFEESMLRRLLQQARADLMRQQSASNKPFTTPLSVLVGNYVRHCLRAELAICKDWTNDFDAYVRLQLAPVDRLIALVGSVARQPAYSNAHPSHDGVVANNIWLEGQAKQYVIDFKNELNRKFAGRISAPLMF